jgi:hypothetical protein
MPTAAKTYMQIAGYYFSIPNQADIEYLPDEQQSKIKWAMAKMQLEHMQACGTLKPVNKWTDLKKPIREQILTKVYGSIYASKPPAITNKIQVFERM